MQLEMGEFFESLNAALVQTVTALGGYKKVGPVLRPELTIDAAAQWLRDCLNTDRREKLAPEQVLLLMRHAKQAGYHAAMNYFAFDAGYKATPVDPRAQEAELQEKFVNAVESLKNIQAQMERAQRSTI